MVQDVAADCILKEPVETLSLKMGQDTWSNQKLLLICWVLKLVNDSNLQLMHDGSWGWECDRGNGMSSRKLSLLCKRLKKRNINGAFGLGARARGSSKHWAMSNDIRLPIIGQHSSGSGSMCVKMIETFVQVPLILTINKAALNPIYFHQILNIACALISITPPHFPSHPLISTWHTGHLEKKSQLAIKHTIETNKMDLLMGDKSDHTSHGPETLQEDSSAIW